MKLIRYLLGRLILMVDWLTAPKKPGHSAETQERLNLATKNMALYQFHACPFCVKTRRAIRRLGLNIEIRDARNNPKWKQQLVEQGGRYQVPALFIDDENGGRWMYESRDIIAWLEQEFSV